jgi:ubiquitin-protein ligase
MTPERRALVMMGHFKKATTAPNPYVKFMMSEGDATKWYAILGGFSGDDDEFAGGEYIVRVEATSDFPYKPPWFYFMTPNGVYDINTKVCINIGGYHSDNYRATLGMSGFIEQLVSGMIGWRTLGGGIAIVNTTVEKKRELAQMSEQYNAEHNADVVNAVMETYREYSAKWQKPPE